ncbi:MAG: intermembrane phospholipid transport protein YdbH family protein [Litorimonas sp.]
MRPSAKSTTKRSPLKRALRIIAWVVFTVLLAIALAAAWAWSNRYELIERQAITYFDSLGIQADLKIRSASGKKADIRDIRLAYDGKPFLRVNRLQAAYQWRDLLNGTVERLDFTGLDATVTIDETGAIIDGWRPPSSEGGSAFPVRGIGVTDASILLQTPYGEIPIKGDAEVSNADTFTVEGTLEPFTLARDGISLSADGPLSITGRADSYSVYLPSTRLTLLQPSGTLKNTTLTLNGSLQKDTGVIKSIAKIQGGSFNSSTGVAGQVTGLDIDGRWDGTQFSASVETDLVAVTMTDPVRREDLARTLSLASALAEVPVAMNFAPGIVAPIRDLLAGSDISASLSVLITDTQRRLELQRPMTLRTDRTQATIAPVETAPLYQYMTGRGDYAIAMKASLSRPIPLTLDPLQVRILSTDGLSIDGIASASGRLKTQSNWRTQTQDGRPARLGPLSVGFDYVAPLAAPSRLVLRGSANYDGDIPGGYAQGLVAGGTLTAQLSENRTTVDFNPDRMLKIAQLETTSEWNVADFEGRLQPASPIYRRNGIDRAMMRTALVDASLTASRPATDLVEAATLYLQFAHADLAGDIRLDAQNWAIGFSDLALQSETFPLAGTDLVLPRGELNVGLSSEGRSTFALTAPSSTVTTPAYAVRDMAIEAQGTAEQYELTYNNGRVKVLTQGDSSFPIPVLPLSGTLLFEAGQFTGTAQTSLPRAPATPIDIDYRMIDGLGDANIKIRGLQFKPGGLQPQDLAPALRGKIAQVDGGINADLHILFSSASAPTGTGTVEIINMSLGTAPGPITGLSGIVELTSLFPVVTAPDQQLTIQTFNPGFPLEDGELTYALVAEGVAISRAVFPLGEGQVSFDPFTWIYGASENRITLRVSEVEVGEFLKGLGNGKLSISGALEGTIPVVVRGIDVLVENGRLEVEDGGVIRYQGEDVADAIPNEFAAKAIEALKNFNYDALFIELNGPLDGEIKLGLQFTGSNPEILYNSPFQFDVSVEGELFNIARSLNPNGLQQRVLTSVQQNQTPNE